MKKILLILITLFMLMGCTSNDKQDDVSYEEIKYENTVEITAGKADMSGYVLLKDNNHVYLETSAGEINRLFNEKGTAIVYLGYINCPWCNRAVPVLNDIAKETGLTVYYLDVYGELTDGIDELINIHLAPVTGEDGLYVPFVMAIKNGEILGQHVSMVDSYTDATKDPTEAQVKELKDIYYDLFTKLK